MAKNEKSSQKTASLAGKVLQQKSATSAAKSLGGSVLTQAADKKSGEIGQPTPVRRTPSPKRLTKPTPVMPE